MPFKFVQSIFLPHNSQSVGARCIARMTKYHVATENAANPMMRYVIIIIFAVVICFCFAGRMRNVSCISERLSQIYSKSFAPIKNLSKLTLKSISGCLRALFEIRMKHARVLSGTPARFISGVRAFSRRRAHVFSARTRADCERRAGLQP